MSDATEGLLDVRTVRRVAASCGWTVTEFAEFYEPRARAELDEIDEACARGDHPAILRLTHGAAGSSATAGIRALTDQWRRVEEIARTRPDAPLTDELAKTRALLEEALVALHALGSHA